MVPYQYKGVLYFLEFHAQDYNLAVELATCVFGENATKYLYQKKIFKD